VADGNFKFEHMVIQNSTKDVYLSDGRGFVVGDEEYQKHVAASVQSKQVIIPPVDFFQCHF